MAWGQGYQQSYILHCNIVETQSKNEIPLCSVHYNEFFRAMNPQKCARCGLKPTRGKQINRHPPNPQLLNKILSASTGFQGQLKPDNIVCKSCYDFHRSLVCECREMSTDEHLQLLLCQLNSQCVDITTKIATEIIIQVGKQLLNNHALLLSKVYTDFSARLHKEGVESVPSKRWLLAEIVIKLSPHV